MSVEDVKLRVDELINSLDVFEYVGLKTENEERSILEDSKRFDEIESSIKVDVENIESVNESLEQEDKEHKKIQGYKEEYEQKAADIKKYLCNSSIEQKIKES